MAWLTYTRLFANFQVWFPSAVVVLVVSIYMCEIHDVLKVSLP